MINKEIYNKIHHSSTIKASYNLGTGEIFYEIVNIIFTQKDIDFKVTSL